MEFRIVSTYLTSGTNNAKKRRSKLWRYTKKEFVAIDASAIPDSTYDMEVWRNTFFRRTMHDARAR